MMTKRRFYNFVLMLCFVTGIMAALGSMAQAQNNPNDRNFLANPQYEHLTRQLIRNVKNFDYERYRAQYTMSRGYDPMGTAARDTLLDIAYKVQNEEDPEAVEAALKAYKDHVKTHMANISVVMMAMNLAKDDARFGNPKFFERIRRGLFASVKQFGNGSSLHNAYHVVTLAEETMLLSSLRVKVKNTTPAHTGMLYYNMHQIEVPRGERPYTIFVDITKPMSYLVQKENANVPVFSVRR